MPEQGLYLPSLGLEELVVRRMEDYVEKIRSKNMLGCVLDAN